MKPIFLLCAFFILFFTGCSGQSKSQMPPFQQIGYNQYGNNKVFDRILIVSSTSSIILGENAHFAIKGKPGGKYNIVATYKIEDTIYTTSQSKKADSEGYVTWSFNISVKTLPGTYPISIRGEGQEVDTSYTVTSTNLK